MSAREGWAPVLRRWLKFSAVGWLGVGVQLGVLSALVGLASAHYLVATVVAVECAIVHNYFWHERWTFQERRLGHVPGRLARLLRFNAASGTVSLLGNVGFMSLFVGHLGLHYVAGNLMSIASCALLNFVLSDRVVFLVSSETAG